MEETKKVSIIINNYNYGHYLSEAIDSSLTQTYANVEIIVVDDGSKDDSRSVMTSYGEKIIPIFKENGGQSSALNAGYSASQGDIICFLDADDTFLPDKISTIVNIFENNPDIEWCFHTLHLIDIDTKKTINIHQPSIAQDLDFREHMKTGKKLPYIPCSTSGLCFSRALLDKVFSLPNEIRITIDNYLKFTAFALAKGYFIDQKIAIQKIHAQNAYTLKPDKLSLKAKILILTAYYMRQNFPDLFKFTDGLFILGTSMLFRIGNIEPEYKKIMTHYLISTKIHRQFFIFLRIFSSYLKNPEGVSKKGTLYA